MNSVAAFNELASLLRLANSERISTDNRMRLRKLFNDLNELHENKLVDFPDWESVRSQVLTHSRKNINILQAARDFYALEALSAMLCDKKQNNFEPLKHSHARWYAEFEAFRSRYAAKLANAIFDYTVLVVAGEMRHAGSQSSYYIRDFECNCDCGRDTVYYNCAKWEPFSVLAAGKAVFDERVVRWKDSFGGHKWKTIAEAGMKRNKLCDVAFIDHCVDLSHNNSVYFDKGARIFVLDNKTAYKYFLDHKRDAAPRELFATLSNEVKSILAKANVLGIIPISIDDVSVTCEGVNNVFWVMNYIPVMWGTERLGCELIERTESFGGFTVGERVIGRGSMDRARVAGIPGKIIDISGNLIAVAWKRKIKNSSGHVVGHDCSLPNACKKGYGWHVKCKNLKHVPSHAGFSVGDKVCCVDEHSNLHGLCGTIVEISNSYSTGVCWEKHIKGHSCAGHCPAGYGWYVINKDLVKITEDMQNVA